MGLPVARIDIDIADRVAAVQHFPASCIDTYMRNTRCVIGAYKENEITGLGIGRRYRGTGIEQSLGTGSSHIPDTACGHRPADETGTVEGGVGIAAAPDIGIANILFCFCYQRSKGFILQCRGWNLLDGGRRGVFGYIEAVGEQILPVA